MIIPIIAGPTGVGKTYLSIKLAKIINGEIISADSMQVYKHMDIGTAKATKEEMQGISHHLINIREPEEEYSVAEFSIDVKEKIKEIIDRDKVPIIVGGTGLYLNSLLYGINFEENVDLNYRKELEKEIESNSKKLDELYNKLLTIDKDIAEKISNTDKKRIIRGLEIYYVTGKTKTEIELENRTKQFVINNKKIEFKLFVLNMNREILYEKINKRVDLMFEQGLVNEVEKLKNRLSKTSSQAIGYKEVIMYLNKEIEYDEMKDLIKQRSRNYAKRQFTWFRKNNAIWLDANNQERVLKEILKSI